MWLNMTASRKKALLATVQLLLFVGLSLVVSGVSARSPWQQKVDRSLLGTISQASEAEILIVLEKQADLSAIASLNSKFEKGTAIYRVLTEVARSTQGPIVAELVQSGAVFKQYWISNMIWARGDGTLVESLARRSDVARIHANPWTRLAGLSTPQRDRLTTNLVEANIQLVNAPDVWAIGVTGRGAVIGGQDTGYDWRHPALINQYRGWDGVTASHDYNWHDAIHEDNPNTIPGNRCGYDSPEPCDDQAHGTHTMGTIVGDDGAGNQVGMAPAAKWIGCRNMEQGWGTPATYAECYQWFVAPYPIGGDPFTDGDPSKAPDVINNSWSCPVVEDCTDPDILRSIVDHVRAAGIMTVQSAGNRGSSGCGSIDEPAAIYDASFTVGATDANDQIASFSSRGPSLQDGAFLTKPDVSAPGIGIRSSIPNAQYGFLSGTSMAAPHVSGLVALLVSAEPLLAGEVDLLEQLIHDSAVPRFSDEGCGGDGPMDIPNNTYGRGRIDAREAYNAANKIPFTDVFVPLLFKQ